MDAVRAMKDEPRQLECVLEGVREYAEGYPVELRRNTRTGRLLVTAYNEGHHNSTEIDLLDLIDWLIAHPGAHGLPVL
jgi:hypothetical protein